MGAALLASLQGHSLAWPLLLGRAIYQIERLNDSGLSLQMRWLASGLAGALGGADQRPAPRAPGQNQRPAPRAPERPRSRLGVTIPG